MHMDSKVEITTPGLFRPVLLCLCLCLCNAFSLSPLTSHLSLSAQSRAPAQVPLAQVGTGPPGKVSWSKSSLPRNSGAPKHPLSLEQTWKSLGAATIHSIFKDMLSDGKGRTFGSYHVTVKTPTHLDNIIESSISLTKEPKKPSPKPNPIRSTNPRSRNPVPARYTCMMPCHAFATPLARLQSPSPIPCVIIDRDVWRRRKSRIDSLAQDLLAQGR